VFTWDDLRHFLAVHRSRTLAAAGRALGVDETTVGRRLAALEQALGARLFDRTADGLLLSAAGAAVLAAALRMEAEAATVAVGAAAVERRAQGLVRLTCTEAFGARFLAPRADELRAAHPELVLEFIIAAGALDLSRREADLAVRLSRPARGPLVGRKLGELTVGLYASAGYLERHGAPGPGLRGHAVVLFGSRPLGIPEEGWLARVAAEARVALRSGSTPVQLAAAVAGIGIAALPCYLADSEPELRRVMPGEKVAREIWNAVRRDAAKAGRIRAVVAWLEGVVARHAALLRGELAGG
jgi:DNA-binding transcriptional LysR family regulator